MDSWIEKQIGKIDWNDDKLSRILIILTKIKINKFCFLFSFSLLTVRDWLSLIPPTACVAGFGYVSYLAFCPHARSAVKLVRVNKLIRLEDAKVADFVDIEDIADKAAFCRCWNSKNVCILWYMIIIITLLLIRILLLYWEQQHCVVHTIYMSHNLLMDFNQYYLLSFH